MMKKLIEVLNNDKKTIQPYLIVGGLCLLLFLFKCFSNGNHGTGIDFIREQFDCFGKQQSEITSGTENAEKRIDASAKSTANLELSITESGAVIADCKRIIREIRTRNATQTKSPENAT